MKFLFISFFWYFTMVCLSYSYPKVDQNLPVLSRERKNDHIWLSSFQTVEISRLSCWKLNSVVLLSNLHRIKTTISWSQKSSSLEAEQQDGKTTECQRSTAQYHSGRDPYKNSVSEWQRALHWLIIRVAESLTLAHYQSGREPYFGSLAEWQRALLWLISRVAESLTLAH